MTPADRDYFEIYLSARRRHDAAIGEAVVTLWMWVSRHLVGAFTVTERGRTAALPSGRGGPGLAV